MTGFARPSRFRVGETSVVLPPSTSDALAEPPAVPWPVTQHSEPAGVWSSSVCASVPFGSTRTHCPPVAVSPAAPATQPVLVSKSCEAATLVLIAEIAWWTCSGASSGSLHITPFEDCAVRYQL